MTDFEIAMVLIASFPTIGITTVLIIVVFEAMMRKADRKLKEESRKERIRDQKLDFRNMSDERLRYFVSKDYREGKGFRKNELALVEKIRRDKMRINK